MEPLTRRTLARGAALVAPAALLAVPGRTDGLEPFDSPLLRGRGCAPAGQAGQAAQARHDRQAPGPDARRPVVVQLGEAPAHRGRQRPERHGFHAISAWGQIYEDIHGSPARNVRVACRDISIFILSKRTGKWRRCNASKRINGANYVEDFSGNASKPANLRNEPHGAVSATLGGGYNFHLYSIRSRAKIDPHDVAGVVAVYSARVIMDDPNGVDERHLARYLASAGADYWLDRYVGAYPGTVRDVGIGKARYLTSDWMTLTMSTLPLRKLEKHPPPICVRGRGRG